MNESLIAVLNDAPNMTSSEAVEAIRHYDRGFTEGFAAAIRQGMPPSRMTRIGYSRPPGTTDIKQIAVRMLPEMFDAIKDRAIENNRSISAEIVAALGSSSAVEQRTVNAPVAGSIPASSAKQFEAIQSAVYAALGCTEIDFRSPAKVDTAAAQIARFVVAALTQDQREGG